MISPNVMRTIDYWAGIPICFFLTIWYRIQRLFGLKNPGYDEKPQNILLVELAEMGSTVLAYPAIQKLKQMYPDAAIHFLLFKNIEESMEIMDLVPKKNVMTIDAKSMFTVVRDTLKFMADARKRKIDAVINFEMFARYSTILSYISGARKRVGFHAYTQEGLYIGNFLTHKVIYNPHIHTAHSFIALVNSLSLPITEVPMPKFSVLKEKLEVSKITSDKNARQNIWKILKEANPEINDSKKLILVNPNASKLIAIRKWPIEHYARLVRKLLQDPNVYVGITGVASEKPDARFIIDFVKDKRALDLTGKTKLRELIDLYNISELLITNDSGPAHFASLTNVHIMVFFGPETPELYKPLSDKCTVIYSHFACSPCVSAFNQRLSPCNNNLCLKTIEVENVYQAAVKILHSRKK